MAGIGFSATNYVTQQGSGLGPRTIIVSLAATNITQTQLSAWINYLTTAHGVAGTGDDAFVVAGVSSDQTVTDSSGVQRTNQFVSGTSDVVYLALQGTGAFTDATVEGLTGTPTATILATFDNRA